MGNVCNSVISDVFERYSLPLTVWLWFKFSKVQGKRFDYCFNTVPSMCFRLMFLSKKKNKQHLGMAVSCTSFGVTVTLIYILDLLCKEHISYIICGRNPKCVWMHLWMVICREPFLGHGYLDL